MIADSHCADAVLSLANKVTVVGDVAETLLKFTALWVQTPSDYDVLIAKSVSAQWAKVHQPVISRHGDAAHTLYTKFSLAEPGGKQVVCHRSCDQVISSKQVKEKVRMMCLGCKSKCVIPVVRSDQETFLAKVNLIKVRFPPKQYPTEWKLPVPQPPPSGQSSSSVLRVPSGFPSPTPSRSVSRLEHSQRPRKRQSGAGTSKHAKRKRTLYVQDPQIVGL